jgi:hypothetical protein
MRGRLEAIVLSLVLGSGTLVLGDTQSGSTIARSLTRLTGNHERLALGLCGFVRLAIGLDFVQLRVLDVGVYRINLRFCGLMDALDCGFLGGGQIQGLDNIAMAFGLVGLTGDSVTMGAAGDRCLLLRGPRGIELGALLGRQDGPNFGLRPGPNCFELGFLGISQMQFWGAGGAGCSGGALGLLGDRAVTHQRRN